MMITVTMNHQYDFQCAFRIECHQSGFSDIYCEHIAHILALWSLYYNLQCTFSIEALPGFLDNGKRGIYFSGTGEQRPIFEGNGNKDNIGEQGS